MDFDDFDRPLHPQLRRKTKWNYKRIAVALSAVMLLSTIAVYGGVTLAGKISDGQRENIAISSSETVSVPATVAKPVVAGTTTTTEQRYIQYIVKNGDSFYAIALEQKTTVEKIKKLNKIPAENNDLQIGMILKIPTNQPVPDTKTDAQSEPDSSIKPSRQEVTNGPENEKRISLTLDAGSTSDATPQTLKALKNAGVKATFFLTGKWVEENQELAKQIAENGHVIGNHTYSHPDLTKETESDIVKQLSDAEDLIKSITGKSPKPLFRPPYGARDGRILRIASEEGYRSIYWTTDALDWKPGMKPDQIKNRILAALGNGSIILMHCGSRQTSEMLPELIKEIKNRGYEIVTVPQLFE